MAAMAQTSAESEADSHVSEMGEIARIVVVSPISIVVPTFRERENIPLLIERIGKLAETDNLTVELIFMDDKSKDGSLELVRELGLDWVRFVERDGERGLSAAVIDGIRLAKYPVVVCMDCDLSHPPERIPQMVLGLSSGQEFVIGSRYVSGGSTDDDWGFFRWLNSRIATVLARPLTSVRDPMSGFFAMRRDDMNRAKELNPVGYKIALELIVKCGFDRVAEVPIHFADRIYGESKLTLIEQLKYIKHLRRLYVHKFASAMYLLQFLTVGATGVVVNMVVLTALLALGVPPTVGIAAGIAVSLFTNFLLNRRFTFSYARHERFLKQFIGFAAASAIGIVVNFLTSFLLLHYALPEGRQSVYIASLCGIAAGMLFNFLGSRYVVFRKQHIRD
jgi:dolichol-phosphate mannosyltransferase